MWSEYVNITDSQMDGYTAASPCYV